MPTSLWGPVLWADILYVYRYYNLLMCMSCETKGQSHDRVSPLIDVNTVLSFFVCVDVVVC